MPRSKKVRKDISADRAYKFENMTELLKFMQYHPILEMVRLAMAEETEPKVKYWCHKTVCDYVFERKAQTKKVDADINVLHKMDEKLLMQDLPRLIAMESDRMRSRGQVHPIIRDLEVIEVQTREPEETNFLETSEEEIRRLGYQEEDHENGGEERGDLGGGQPVLPADRR
jgi:hypothetical protein